MTHAIVGIEQPTWTSLTITGTRVEPLYSIGGDDDRGDGTVPLTGALGHDLPMDTNTVHRVVEQHGHLQAHRGVLDAVAEILGAKPERRRGLGDVSLGSPPPTSSLVGEPLPSPSTSRTSSSMACASRSSPSRPEQPEKVVAARTPPVRDGHAETTFTDLPPGAYEIRVTGVTPGSPVTPVTVPTFVYPHPDLPDDH